MIRKKTFKQARNYYTGRILDIDLAVIHATVSDNPAAEGVASYFATNPKAGSTQWVIDDLISVRCVRDEDTCWGAKGHNSNGLHYEICGQPSWSREQWLTHRPTLVATAQQIAEDMLKYGIPFREAQVVNGKARNGYHTHKGLPGNDHWDPGPHFPMDFLLAEIKKSITVSHRVKTLRPRLALKDRKKRENISVRTQTPGGAVISHTGWKDCRGMLRWLTKHEMAAGAKVGLTWQGKEWTDPNVVGKVAQSILARFDRGA